MSNFLKNRTLLPEVCFLSCMIWSSPICTIAQPSVPGAITTLYATGVQRPQMCDLADNGYLYVVPEEIPGTNNLAVRVYRVGPGGSPVEQFGDTALGDIDSIIIDRAGTFSGVPGALFTAGADLNTDTAAVFEIDPDGHVKTFREGNDLINPDVSAFNDNNRLIQTDYAHSVYEIQSNAVRILLISDANIAATTVDKLGRLVCASYSDSFLRLYSSTGELLNPQFAPSIPDGFVRIGHGGFWGTDVYCLSISGELLRVDTNGVSRVVGTGFSKSLVPTFAPDENIYVCDKEANQIWKISPLRVTISLSAVDICWNSQSNKNYQVQYQSSLTTNAWLDLGVPVAGNGTTNCITDHFVPREPQRFYRIAEMP